jgi:biopolymer transport protein ExbB
MSLPVDAVHAATSAAGGVGVSFDLVSMWRAMGFLAKLVAAVLAAMSIYSLAVVAERLFSFARATRASRRFALELRDLLPAGKLDEARALARQCRRGHLARVLGPALVEYQQPSTGYDVLAAVSRAIERQSLRVGAELRRGLGGLATISSAAPFVGLLGTVGGIITAFQAMAATGSGGLGSVSAGIAEALVTTAFGLFVAIPAVMTFNYFTHRVEAMQVDITESSSELVDFLTKRFQADAAGREVDRKAKSS